MVRMNFDGLISIVIRSSFPSKADSREHTFYSTLNIARLPLPLLLFQFYFAVKHQVCDCLLGLQHIPFNKHVVEYRSLRRIIPFSILGMLMLLC